MGRAEKAIQIYGRKLKRKHHLGDIGVDGTKY
jgi:hypothetical protein